ncbi:uncharacterized protein LOC142323493 [Lycorma delicatula]|uniref:uncharacterized protein LOC142323493 n=1 Tax=Lycorma delicatula TaxID=130591 RepID=UPI003F512743
MAKIILSNANRSILSHDLVGETANDLEVDFIVTTEPNLRTAARGDWWADAVGDVAISNVSGRLGWHLLHRGEGILAVALPDFVLIAGYVSPNINIGDFVQYINDLQRVIQRAPSRPILLGDFNCKSILTGSSYTNARGRIFIDMMMTTGLICLNDCTYTYEARGHRSVLDLTLVDGRWNPSVFSWSVLESETGSDHLATLLVMEGARPSTSATARFRFSPRQVEVVVNKIARTLSDGRIVTPQVLQESIITELSRVPQFGGGRHPVYWWTCEIADQRSVTILA